MKSLNLSDFIVAIILGMVICNTVGVHAVFRDGLRFSTTLTKTGIVVMGCKYSFAGLIKTGSEAIIISLFLFTSAIILMWLSRRLSMSPSLGACLAAGLSICGVSACVAIAPAVRVKNEDIAYTIAVVLMFGLLALFIFPFIGHWLDLSPNQFGAFAGVGIVNSAQAQPVRMKARMGIRKPPVTPGTVPRTGTKTGRRKKRGKKEEEREGPPDGSAPGRLPQTRVRQKPITKKGLQLSLQAFGFPGAEGQN